MRDIPPRSALPPHRSAKASSTKKSATTASQVGEPPLYDALFDPGEPDHSVTSSREGYKQLPTPRRPIKDISLAQKQELAKKICEVDGEVLTKAIALIHSVTGLNGDEELELDIDSLPPRTVTQLYDLVCLGRTPNRGLRRSKRSKMYVDRATSSDNDSDREIKSRMVDMDKRIDERNKRYQEGQQEYAEACVADEAARVAAKAAAQEKGRLAKKREAERKQLRTLQMEKDQTAALVKRRKVLKKELQKIEGQILGKKPT